jgi:uncharacterized LabA/DUF88 family protein
MSKVRADAPGVYLEDTNSTPFSVTGRYALMIDGTSLRYALGALGADIDFRALRRVFGNERQLVRATYYAWCPPGEEDIARPLLDWLCYNGYSVREKRGRVPIGSGAHRRRYGRLSLDIAVDALEGALHIDHLVLFSGDGDLVALVKAVQRSGVRVTAVSTLVTRPAMIADELRRQIDRFIDLRDLLPLVERKRSVREGAGDARVGDGLMPAGSLLK